MGTLEQDLRNVLTQREYGCENKKYYISFYTNDGEKEEKTGCFKSVLGIIENFTPNEKVAIRDSNNDLWWIASKLIMIMRPMSNFELDRFNNESNN